MSLATIVEAVCATQCACLRLQISLYHFLSLLNRLFSTCVAWYSLVSPALPTRKQQKKNLCCKRPNAGRGLRMKLAGTFLPRTCMRKGVKQFFLSVCQFVSLSVCQFVSPVNFFLNLNIDRFKWFLKLTVALKL